MPDREKPSKWYTSRAYLKVRPWDKDQAGRARLALADLGLYPPADLDQADGLEALEANHRAALHDLVEELGRTDLRAAFDLVRLLVVIPHDDALFNTIRRRTVLAIGAAFEAGLVGLDALEAIGKL